MSHLRSLPVAQAETVEPEDMKSRRLAALKEFGIKNPKYQRLIKLQLLMERSVGAEGSMASHTKVSYKGIVQQRTNQKVAEKRISKRNWWTTETSLALLEAVTKFQKSGTHATGESKWKIIAADLMQQPRDAPVMSLTESAKYCYTRYSNMLARRDSVRSDELKKKLETTKFAKSLTRGTPVDSSAQ